MARHPGIFPTFFLSGFECSTFLWDGGAPEILDIVGANVYSFGQMEYRERGKTATSGASRTGNTSTSCAAGNES